MSNLSEEIVTSPWLSVRTKATLLIALSGILYGFLGYFGTELLKDNLSVSAMLFWRFLIAGVWMLFYMTWNGEARLPHGTKWRNLLMPFFLGAICYGGSSAFYFLASQEIGTGLAMVIFFSYPVFVILMAVLAHGWKVNRYIVIGLLAIIFGLFLLKGNQAHPLNLMGIVLAIVTALFYAVYVFKSKAMINKFSPVVFTTLVCFSAAVFFLILSLATKTFAAPASFNSWIFAIALALFATAIPIQLLLEGLKYVSSIKASILSVLEPLVTVFLGVVLLNESLSQLQITGIAIILVGTIVSQFAREA